MARSEVEVVAKTKISFSAFSLTIDRKTTEYTIPYAQQSPLSLGPKTSVTLKVISKDSGEFVPTTTLLMLESPSGKKLTLPMRTKDVGLQSPVHSRAFRPSASTLRARMWPLRWTTRTASTRLPSFAATRCWPLR